MRLTEDVSIIIGNDVDNLRSQIVLNDFKVVVCSCHTHDEYDLIMNNGVGSSEGWLSLNYADVMLFDSEGYFDLAELRIPEKNVQPKFLEKFRLRESFKGIPVIENLCPFMLNPREYRHYDINENVLIAFSESEFALDNLSELKITNNVSLFFKNGSYVAWGFYYPELNLTQKYFEESNTISSKFLTESLKRALNLIEYSNFPELERKDIGFLMRIAELHNEIARNEETMDNPSLIILMDWLFDVCDRNYFGVDFERHFSK